MQFIESLALSIAKEHMQMPLPGTMGASFSGGADVIKFFKAYKSLSSCTGTDPAAKETIGTLLYCCSEMVQETIRLMNWYFRTGSVLLKEEIEDAFCDANSRVWMYTKSYLERLCHDQRDHGQASPKAVILAYDNISCIMIKTGALMEHSWVEMLLGALPTNLSANTITRLEPHPRYPSTLKYEIPRQHILYKCSTTDAHPLLDWDGMSLAPGVSPYSIPAGVPLPQMPVVVNRQAIPSKEILAPAEATEETPIVKSINDIKIEMENILTGGFRRC